MSNSTVNHISSLYCGHLHLKYLQISCVVIFMCILTYLFKDRGFFILKYMHTTNKYRKKMH